MTYPASLVDLIKRYRRIHPGCSRKEIEDLVNAIKEDKYWNAFPGSDALYVVALTRARIRVNKANVVRVTHFEKMLVEQEIAKYCSRGKVLLAMRNGSRYIARYVLTWPAFLNMMRGDAELFYKALIGSDIRELIGAKRVKEIIAAQQGV